MARYRSFLVLIVVALLVFATVAPALAQGNGQIVNASRVNLRSGPGAGFSVVTVLSAGQQLVLLSRNADGSWVQVQTAGGLVGWVNARYVQSYNVPVGNLGVGAQTGQWNAVVTASFLNIRTGPGANFDVVGRLGYGQTMNLVGRNADNSWVQMNVPGGVNGWVSTGYISASILIGNLPLTSNTGVFPTFPQPVSQLGGQTGIVTAPNLNVRYGPGTWFGAFRTLSSGEGVSLVGRNGNGGWLLVQLANGTSGWVNAGFILTSYPIGSLPVRG